MDSPSTPQVRSRELQERPINNLTEQLQGCTISKPKKREQTTATPASQARPRTQRRTTEDQENTPAALDHPDARTSSSVTPSRLNCYSDLQDELSCGICLEICVRPCATPCGLVAQRQMRSRPNFVIAYEPKRISNVHAPIAGHAFCRTCLRKALQHKRQCPKCRDALPTSWQPKVNVALWNTIQLLFPKHAAQAPPPTPPQQQAASAGTASGRNRSTGGSQGAQVLSSSLAGGVFAAHSQAARQAFRPPRPAGANQEDAQRMHSRARQQQHAERFVMPPDLQLMLQGMARTNHHASRQAVAATQLRRSSRQQLGNPFSSAAQRPSEAQAGISIDIEIEGEVMSQLTGRSSQQTAQPMQERRWQRAAAAARVRAAIAEEETLQDNQEEQDLHAAILASLHDSRTEPGVHPDLAAAGGGGTHGSRSPAGSVQQPPAAAAHTSRSSRGRNMRLQPLRQVNRASSDTDEDFFPDFDVSEISDDDDILVTGGILSSQPVAPQSPNHPISASLFGRIHSGRSPRQQWSAPIEHDDSNDEWVHEVAALVDEFANSTTAAVAAGSGSAAGAQGAAIAREPSSSQAAAAAALTARLQQRQGSSSNNTVAGTDDNHQAGQITSTNTVDDHQDLLNILRDFEDDLGPALRQRNRVATTTTASTTATAVVRARRRTPAAAAGTVPYSSAPAAVIAACAPAGVSVGAAAEPRHSAIAAAAIPGGAMEGRRRGGRARVIEDDDSGEPGITAVSATAAGSGDHVGSAAAVAFGSTAAGTVLAAAAVQDEAEQDMNVDDLVLVPSPEPQPLLVRLATFGGHVGRQHTNRGAGTADQQQQRGVLSQMVDAALGAGGAASNSIVVNRSAAAADASTSDIVVADDDFLPSRPNRRGLNAAAAVSAALGRLNGSGSPDRVRGRTRAGRIVPGLRRTRG